MPSTHRERHGPRNTGWLRAAVMGANDGIVSTASLVLGVAAANATHSNILIAGVAGLVGGAMSMAAGEYVSVSSQADAERASHPSRENRAGDGHRKRNRGADVNLRWPWARLRARRASCPAAHEKRSLWGHILVMSSASQKPTRRGLFRLHSRPPQHSP